jgi:hypothetical protein
MDCRIVFKQILKTEWGAVDWVLLAQLWEKWYAVLGTVMVLWVL